MKYSVLYSLSTAIVKKHFAVDKPFSNYIICTEGLIQNLDQYIRTIGYILMKYSVLYSLSTAIVKKHFAVDKPFSN